MPRLALVLSVLTVALLSLPGGSALAGDADEDPIVLTNKDLERLAVKENDPSAGDESSTGLILISSPPGRQPEAMKASQEPGVEANDGVTDAGQTKGFDGPAVSWQEEYYRLKALALRRAMERGDPIDFGEVAEPKQPAGSQDAAPLPHRAACLYAADGSLIHAPRGLPCRPNRQEGDTPRTTSSQAGHDNSCIYGPQGKVLYAPPGESCRHAPASRN